MHTEELSWFSRQANLELFYLSECLSHVCKCVTCTSSDCRGQKTASSDSLQLELKMLMSYHLGANNQANTQRELSLTRQI